MTTVQVIALPGRAALRIGTASAVVRPRAAAVAGALTLLALAVGAVAISVGDYVVPLPDVLRALVGSGDAGALLVVRDLRLPRVLTGLLVGAAFGLAGALTQSVARNPLASPDVVGLTTGASAGAVLAILVGLPVAVPVAAVVGGGLVAALLVALSWRAGFSGPRLVLVGIGLAAAGSALTDYLLVRAEIDQAQRAVVWLTGSLNGRGWEHARPVGLALLVLLPLALALGRQLRLLALGDDTARALGVRLDRSRLALIAVAVGLAGVATASAGPVLFVGLVAPQIALRLARTPGPSLAASAAAGALLVVAADLVGRTGLSTVGLPDAELPVGAVTALVGAPVLLWLLRQSTRGRTS